MRLCGNIICNQKGVSVIAVVAAMLILSAMGVTLISLVTTGSDVSVNQLQSERALFVAAGGAEYSIKQLKDNPAYTGDINKPLGNGTFTSTVTDIGGGLKTVRSTSTVGNSTRVISANEIGGIVFDAASSGSGSLVTLTWPHTVGTGPNRILVVGVSVRNNAGQTVTGVTYAGTALTQAGAISNGTNSRVGIWRLVAPATGPNNIIVTLSAAAVAVGGAVSLKGVDPLTPIDAAFAGNTGNGRDPNVLITTVTSNAWVIDTIAIPTNSTPGAGAGQTERWNTAITGNFSGAGSTAGPVTPAGAVTMSWSWSGGPQEQWAAGAVAIRPAAGEATISSRQEVY